MVPIKAGSGDCGLASSQAGDLQKNVFVVYMRVVLMCNCRAQILAKKVSPRAFRERPGVKGQAAGEIGIEGTTIEHPIEVLPLPDPHSKLTSPLLL